MSITIQPKMDYSFLFSSLGKGAASVAGSNFLIQYASIKDGSYGKLMKAYYAETANDTVKSIVNDKNTSGRADAKTLAEVQSTADALKDAADALLEKGSDSVFAKKDVTTVDENGVETTQKDYDREAIFQAVDTFVTSYNSAVDAMEESGSSSIENRAKNMVNATKANEKMLGKLGITINSDNTLSLDKEAFMKADMSTAKSLFGENGSYGYRVSAQASMISFTADREANRMSTYNFAGNYNNPFGSGNLFDSYF